MPKSLEGALTRAYVQAPEGPVFSGVAFQCMPSELNSITTPVKGWVPRFQLPGQCSTAERALPTASKVPSSRAAAVSAAASV